MQNTITFSEKNKGWTSFHDLTPSLMCRLNNRFFVVKNGQLYMQHDRENPVMNTFFGTKYPSKITTIFNEAPSEDKIMKNLIQEGTHPWKATIETNLSQGTIEASEFNQVGSKWLAHTRKNEDTNDITDRVQGIGNIISVNVNEITFAQIPTLVSVGETLFQQNVSTQEEIGIITNIDKLTNTITVASIVTTPVVDRFSYSVKNARVQGAEIRGYYAQVTLENDDDENVELFAINSNMVQSFVPTEYK